MDNINSQAINQGIEAMRVYQTLQGGETPRFGRKTGRTRIDEVPYFLGGVGIEHKKVKRIEIDAYQIVPQQDVRGEITYKVPAWVSQHQCSIGEYIGVEWANQP